ncbi:aminopeptidase P N-terminal domain-containing protein [SAR86 cluster bacterium]|nr:aminopeptidase P N-terminal domain-containing protein [SAR86 cluster bacterium]
MDDFNNKTYVKRRKEISKLMESNSCFLINSANLKFRNNDSSYFFRQDSNFYYLSGFVEPDSLIMIENNGKSTLFCRERNLELEKWDGFMHGVDGAKGTFGFDECFDITEKENLIPEMIKGKTNLYCLIGKDKNFDASVSSWVNKANNLERHQANIDIKNFSNELGMMRLIKDEHELSLMRKSCEIAAKAHKKALMNIKKGMSEFDIESLYLNYFREGGSNFPSYTPIVAGGSNACILHYIENNKTIKESDLVLVDAGCEYNYYASDITRTFPISGKFSAEQKAIYEVVLEAHKKSTEAIVVGNSCMNPQKTSEEVISQGLKDLGFLKEPLEEILEKKLFREFYYHKIGHWIGLDVHDDSPYTYKDEEIKFKENMIMTIEPGIYINESAPVDSKWKGIGIRIEDDILATNKGSINLTNEVPSHSDEIEKLMA